jgi:carbon storage regulator CsrA
MYLLTRKIGEAVVIAKNIYCKVVSIGQNNVVLGFEAPEFVRIEREEIEKLVLEHEMDLVHAFIDTIPEEQLLQEIYNEQRQRFRVIKPNN